MLDELVCEFILHEPLALQQCSAVGRAKRGSGVRTLVNVSKCEPRGPGSAPSRRVIVQVWAFSQCPS